MQQELVIGGYRPDGPDSIDALLVGFYEGKELRFAGKVRAGFVTHVRRELRTQLKPLRISECPFANLPDARLSRWGAGITAEQMHEMEWVKPRLVAKIRFVEWTSDNRLRHARFRGLRPTSPPRTFGGSKSTIGRYRRTPGHPEMAQISCRESVLASVQAHSNHATWRRHFRNYVKQWVKYWWAVLGSNQWPLPCESSALPLS